MRHVLSSVAAALLAVVLVPMSQPAAQSKVEVGVADPHSAEVDAVAVSPNGKLVLTGSQDTTVKLWEAESGRLIRTYRGHDDRILNVAFSPDGQRFASSGLDFKIVLWSIDSMDPLWTTNNSAFSGQNPIFFQDGARILSSGTSGLSILNAETGAITGGLRTMDADQIALSRDGNWIAARGSFKKTFQLWNVATGKVERTISGHDGNIDDIDISPDGKLLLSLSKDDSSVRIWNASDGKLVRRIHSTTRTGPCARFVNGPDRVLVTSSDSALVYSAETGKAIKALGFDTSDCFAVFPDAAHVVVPEYSKAKIMNLATGELVRYLGATAVDSSDMVPPSASGGGWTKAELKNPETAVWAPAQVRSLAFLDGGTKLATTSAEGLNQIIDLSSGNITTVGSPPLLHKLTGMAYPADGSKLLLYEQYTAAIWDRPPAGPHEQFHFRIGELWSIAMSRDGTRAAFSGPAQIDLVNMVSGKRTLSYTLDGDVSRVAISGDGTIVAHSDRAGRLELRKFEDGKEWLSAVYAIKKFDGQSIWTDSLALSADGRVLATSEDNRLRIWSHDQKTLREVASATEDGGNIEDLAFSSDGNLLVSGAANGNVKIWDPSTATVVKALEGATGSINEVRFSPDDRLVAAAGVGGVTIWSAASGALIAKAYFYANGECVVITPEGFFSASSPRSAQLLSLVRGADTFSAGQIWQSLFNPDLVREKFAGDPHEEVKTAAELVSLDRVLDSGKPPAVEILIPAEGADISDEVGTAVAKISNQGGGIGRIEWRVNGITVGVASAPDGTAPEHAASRSIALDAGANTVEVVAYNGGNLLTSLPSQVKVTRNSDAPPVKPKLYVLAIGVDDHKDAKGIDAVTGKKVGFGPLKLAVKDARAFGAALSEAGKGQYEHVDVTYAIDGAATAGGIDAAINRIAAAIHPRDVFIFYAASHGISRKGRFYLIPHGYSSEGGDFDAALAKHAIGQETLQDWIANRVNARKALILLDTCESGALVGGATVSRTDTPVSEAAIGRLHEATGRPVLTAAASGQFAHEGVIARSGISHGIFTWSILDALRNGDVNGNKTIELTELVSHVQSAVPKLAAELGGAGRAVSTARKAVFGEQSARFGSRGEDFTLVDRLQ
ncbi:caspase family protein [uncultured Hyphomicrobium sp.]|uniref:WD40 domain-containing protein n=1 Tax=uncultured Hyphomicrobium sp. TaxID=194373 RepID=UPI0025F8A104|nr:caspase family protein [uncultured Hyphomicrobium sp.]